jgi:nucleotide-binding universal stress UspA family protein
LYSKILAPVDGSENSIRSLRHALFLSSKLGSKLSVLNVLEILPVGYVQSQIIVDSIIDALENESKKVFERVDEESREFDVKYEPVLIRGNQVAPIIIDHADQKNVDVIVMGSRGRGKFKTAIMGSVAHNVFHHTNKPMLIIK